MESGVPRVEDSRGRFCSGVGIEDISVISVRPLLGGSGELDGRFGEGFGLDFWSTVESSVPTRSEISSSFSGVHARVVLSGILAAVASKCTTALMLSIGSIKGR